MIVASIPITFKSGRAADLLGHMTETGREYEFVPDITLPEGCSAAIEIVKPDGMFVIAECSIVEGNIIVTLPDQALVVRGLAHYIIRITTADDKIIFSAAGSIWVDDALITNEMLESISEVYGLVFPDDFLTSADLADYAKKSEIPQIEANPAGAADYDLTKLKLNNVIYKIPDAAVTQTILYTATAMTDMEINVDLTAYDEYIIFANDTLPSAQIPQGNSFSKSVFQYVLSMSNPNIALYGYSTAYCSYTVSSNKLTFAENGLNYRIVMIVGLKFGVTHQAHAL